MIAGTVYVRLVVRCDRDRVGEAVENDDGGASEEAAERGRRARPPTRDLLDRMHQVPCEIPDPGVSEAPGRADARLSLARWFAEAPRGLQRIPRPPRGWHRRVPVPAVYPARACVVR